jgi:hypothetical protein
VTFVVKTPIILLVLIGLSSIILVWNRKSRGRAFFLLIPSAIYFLVSMQSSLNIGYRHLLPILPFLLILASGLASPKIKAPKFLASRPAFGPALLLAAACIVLVIDLFMHPSYLSYFNLFAGGPENGHKVIVDSNIDWGQDMKRLKEWIDENDIDEVKLSWFGTANPDYYGIQYEPLPGLPYYYNLWWDVPFDTQSPEPGIYVISVSNLWEIPLENKTVFAWFRDRTPDEKIGYSIFIYLVDGDA